MGTANERGAYHGCSALSVDRAALGVDLFLLVNVVDPLVVDSCSSVDSIGSPDRFSCSFSFFVVVRSIGRVPADRSFLLSPMSLVGF